MSARTTVRKRFLRSYVAVLLVGLLLTTAITAVALRETEVRRETEFLRNRAVLIADLVASVASRETSMMEMNRQLRAMTATEGLLFYLSDAPDATMPGRQGAGAHGMWGVDLQNDDVRDLLNTMLLDAQMAELTEGDSDAPRILRMSPDTWWDFPTLIAGWDTPAGQVLVLRSPEYRASFMDQRLPVLYLGIAAAFAVVGLLSYLVLTGLVRRMLRPLNDIRQLAEQVADGRYDQQVTPAREEELAVIGDAVNRMVRRLDELESQRLSFTAQLAHELRTPLTMLRASLKGIRDGVVEPEEIPDFLDAALLETTRLQRLTDDLVDLSVLERSEFPLNVEETDVAGLIRSVAAEIRPACKAREQELTLSVFDPLSVPVDPARIRQVLFNLLSNSVRHAGEGGRIDVSADRHAGMLRVSVRDSGPGIPLDQLTHLFDRYRSTEHVRGSGLGLAISRAIVEAHGGSIQAASDGHSYTELSFSVPA